MKNLIFIIFASIFFVACKNKKDNKVSVNASQPSYTNACCCSAFFNVGSGKVFVLSIFTPNADGINDIFRLIGNANITLIYDVKISDNSFNLLHVIDTCFGIANAQSWNGYINATDRHRGIINITCKVEDVNNVVSTFTAQSCSFVCDTVLASSVIANLPNCVLEASFDPVNFTAPFASGETTCLQ